MLQNSLTTMAFSPLRFSLLWFLVTTITSFSLTTSTPDVVTIHNPPSHTHQLIVSLVHRHRITAVRLIDPDPELIRAFSYSSVSLLLSIPNTLVHSLAGNRSNAAVWLQTHVVPFYRRANISAISVGSDVFSSSEDLADALLPAINNIHVALHELGIRRISVSTTFSLIPLITSAFPPSSAEFGEPLNGAIIRPLLEFLEETNSSFSVSIHPYDHYRLNHEIVLGYALFQDLPYSFLDDRTTGVRCQNVFDTMVDAVLSAMAVAGHENIPVVVTETGWPNSPATLEENDAKQGFSKMYLRGLLKHLKSGVGTPLNKQEIYVFDKERGQGNSNASFRQWGIFYPNLTNQYHLQHSGSYRTVGGCGFITALALSLMVLATLGSSSDDEEPYNKNRCSRCHLLEEESIILARGKTRKKIIHKKYVCSRCRSNKHPGDDNSGPIWDCSECLKLSSAYHALQKHVKDHRKKKVCDSVYCATVIDSGDTEHVHDNSRYYKYQKVWYKRH